MRFRLFFFCLVLFSLFPFGAVSGADDPTQIDGVTQQERVMAIGKVTSYFRDGEKILQRMVPGNVGLNSVFYIVREGENVFTCKVGVLGTEFQINEQERLLVKTPFAIKLGGDKEGKITRITIYTHDFATTLDGYSLKSNAIVPWSTAQLSKWRKQRGEGAH